MLGAEEGNLRHALELARAAGLWDAAAGCLQGLNVLYARTGRGGEWARLVDDVTPEFTDPATGGPLPGRDQQWRNVTGYRVRLARQARDWPAATTLETTLIAWLRDQADAALAAPPAALTAAQRIQIYNLGVALNELGIILRHQDDPGCLPLLQEALALAQRTGDRSSEATRAFNLGNAYLTVPGLRDLDQARHWHQHTLSLRDDEDRMGRASSHSQLGQLALERFDDAQDAGAAKAVLLGHLNTALGHYQQALDLFPAGDHEHRAAVEHQLGIIYDRAGDSGQALRHYQQSLHHEEARGNIFGAGQTRYAIAVLHTRAGRAGDALAYARAALANFQQAGPGAARDADRARQLIADLEQPRR